VVITAGYSASLAAGWWHTPKADLAGAMAACLEGRRLQIAPGLRLAPVLSRELTTFKVRVTPAGNEVFGAWRERDHDDLVLAVTLCVWYGERGVPAQVIFLDRQGDGEAPACDVPQPLPAACPRCFSDLAGGQCVFCEWRAPR
jgi:hypothetical protein